MVCQRNVEHAVWPGNRRFNLARAVDKQIGRLTSLRSPETPRRAEGRKSSDLWVHMVAKRTAHGLPTQRCTRGLAWQQAVQSRTGRRQTNRATYVAPLAGDTTASGRTPLPDLSTPTARHHVDAGLFDSVHVNCHRIRSGHSATKEDCHQEIIPVAIVSVRLASLVRNCLYQPRNHDQSDRFRRPFSDDHKIKASTRNLEVDEIRIEHRLTVHRYDQVTTL